MPFLGKHDVFRSTFVPTVLKKTLVRMPIRILQNTWIRIWNQQNAWTWSRIQQNAWIRILIQQKWLDPDAAKFMDLDLDSAKCLDRILMPRSGFGFSKMPGYGCSKIYGSGSEFLVSLNPKPRQAGGGARGGARSPHLDRKRITPPIYSNCGYY
jgi:hypothetical protein